MSAELAYLSADHWPCDLKCCVSMAVVASCSQDFFRSLVKCQTYILAECCVSWSLCSFFRFNAHSLAFVNTSFEKHVYLLVWQFRRTKQCYLFQHNSYLSSWNWKVAHLVHVNEHYSQLCLMLYGRRQIWWPKYFLNQ